MQSTNEGLTLNDIADELCATRRTAERVKNFILRNFPQIDELPSLDRFKRWGFINLTGQREFASGFIGFSENELFELEKLKKQFKEDNNRAEILKSIIDKLKALMRDTRNYQDFKFDNIKALLELEGYAINQFSRQKLNTAILSTIREAFKANKKLSFNYTKRNNEKSLKIVEPYGVLYHFKSYLVAKDGIVKLFDLDCIENATIEKETFKPDKDFSLEEFSNRSFGIYQEEPFKVRLLFDKKASKDAQNYYFHPNQEIKLNENDTVEICFVAGGTKAMCWELFKWGEHVKILEPQVLKDIYNEQLTRALKVN